MTLQEFGAYLTEKRQARSLSIQDIANSLKLSPRVVQAMEEINLDDLPHAAYVRAFYFSYAATLDIDDELVCTALEELVVEPVDDSSSVYIPIKSSGRRLGTLLLLFLFVVGLFAVLYAIMSSSIVSDLSSMTSKPKAQQSEQVFSSDLTLAENPFAESSTSITENTDENLEAKQSSEIRKELAPVFPATAHKANPADVTKQNVAALLAGTKKAVNAANKKAPVADTSAQSGQKTVHPIVDDAPTVLVKPPTAIAQAPKPTAPPVAPVAVPAKPVDTRYLQMNLGTRHTLVITGLNDSWLRVTVGVTVRQFSIKKGQTLTVRFDNTATLRFGNAGGITASLDGKKLPVLGVSGEVRTLTFPNS